MKKYMIFLLVLFLLISVSGCAEKELPEENHEETIEETGSTDMQLANPFTYAESLEELNGLSDLSFEVLPDTIADTYVPESYACAQSLGLIQVNYTDPDRKDSSVLIRKAWLTYEPEHVKKDISGDFHTYEEYAEVDGIDFSYGRAGNKGLVNVAEWDDGTYAYVIVANPGTDQGLSEEVVIDLVRTIR